MQPRKEGGGPGLRTQEDADLGRATVQIVPTRHFEKRFLERIGDWLPIPHHEQPFLESGFLVKSWRAHTYYLDVEGVGRYVLAESGTDLIGITVLPQLYCHCDSDGSCAGQIESHPKQTHESSVLGW